VSAVGTGLVHPWSIAFPTRKTMLVTEQPGDCESFATASCCRNQRGWHLARSSAGAKPGTDLLHFVAVHPQFAQNGLVYVSHLKFGERGNTVAISRGRFDGTTLQDVKEIFVADAWESSGNTAARIFFGPGGMLFLTVGDRDRAVLPEQRQGRQQPAHARRRRSTTTSARRCA
jgi:glucose/arabinose dehydrogenase